MKTTSSLLLSFKNQINNTSLLLILLIGLVLRIPLMSRGLSFDEMFIVISYIHHCSFLDVFKNFWLTNHLGYTIIEYTLYHYLGVAEWILRIPALIFGMGGILFLWYWTRQYFGKSIALLSSFFLALSPTHIMWSVSARGYSAFAFFALLSTCYYFNSLNIPSKRINWKLTLTNVIGLSFHVFFLAIILIQIIHLLWISCKQFNKTSINKINLQNVWKSIALVILLSSLIYLPITFHTLSFLITDHHNHHLVNSFPIKLLSDLLALYVLPFGFLMPILIFIGFKNSQNKDLQNWHTYLILLYLSPLIVWLSQPYYLFTRFFAYLLPFLFLLLSIGIVFIIKRNQSKFKRIFSILLLSLILALTIWSWHSDFEYFTKDYHAGVYKESVMFAESIASSPQTHFCAIGDYTAKYFQYYSSRPIELLNTVESFQSWGEKSRDFICFISTSEPLNEEQKKILYILLKYYSYKNFLSTFIFFPKT